MTLSIHSTGLSINSSGVNIHITVISIHQLLTVLLCTDTGTSRSVWWWFNMLLCVLRHRLTMITQYSTITALSIHIIGPGINSTGLSIHQLFTVLLCTDAIMSVWFNASSVWLWFNMLLWAATICSLWWFNVVLQLLANVLYKPACQSQKHTLTLAMNYELITSQSLQQTTVC